MEGFQQQKGLKLLKVIYQMDYCQQLLIRATHIWIYTPFASQYVLMTVIIIATLSQTLK